jgi:hypothetical protein
MQLSDLASEESLKDSGTLSMNASVPCVGRLLGYNAPRITPINSENPLDDI